MSRPVKSFEDVASDAIDAVATFGLILLFAVLAGAGGLVVTSVAVILQLVRDLP